jgi:hypothetical protein
MKNGDENFIKILIELFFKKIHEKFTKRHFFNEKHGI